MTYDFYLDEAVKAIAYKSITEENGADSQLIAFINNDGKLGEELGLEQFSSYSNETQHEILLSKLNSDFLEKLACDDINTICQKNVVFNEEKSVIDQLELINIRLSTLLIAEDRLYSYKNRKSELLKDTSLKSDHLDSALEGLGTTIKETYTSMVAKAKESISSLGEMFPTAKSIVDKIIVKITSLIEKIKEKAEKLNKTIKAHPIKSILIAITTIVAVAGAIYIYKEYNKGYSLSEIKHVESGQKVKERLEKTKSFSQSLEKDIIAHEEKMKDLKVSLEELSKNKDITKNEIEALRKKYNQTAIKWKVPSEQFESMEKERQKLFDEWRKIASRAGDKQLRVGERYERWLDNKNITGSEKQSLLKKIETKQADLTSAAERAGNRYTDYKWNLYDEREKAQKVLNTANRITVDTHNLTIDKLTNKLKDVDNNINTVNSTILGFDSKARRMKEAILESKTKISNYENEISSHTQLWENQKRSLYSKFQSTFKDTFLETKNDYVTLSNRIEVPRAEFIAAFPPIPETKTTQVLNWTAVNLGTLGSKLNESFSKVGNSLKEFSASASSEKITSVTSKCISAVYYLIKEIIVKCLHFISNTLISVFNQLS